MEKKLMQEIMEKGDILDLSGSEIADRLNPNELILALDGTMYVVRFEEVK